MGGAFDRMVDTRRTLHACPELGFEEWATTSLIKDRLTHLGLRHEPDPTPTGAVFTLEGGRPGRTVLLRADIDALPVTEAVDLPFASGVEGRMHACGHDVHTAALLGVAEALVASADELAGQFVMVFQPAEECLDGARSMVEAGLLSAARPDAVIGFHVASPLPVGMVGVRQGVAMSEAHSVRVQILGPGGHAATQGDVGNVVTALTDLAAELGGVVDGMTFEGVNCVCSAGVLRAGTANNVVPDRALLEGTLRTFTDAQRQEAQWRLGDLCARVADRYDVTVEIGYPDACPAVVNDPAVTVAVETAALGMLGGDKVLQLPPVAPSDDVSELLRRVPGCYFMVGGGRLDGSSGMHHSPRFAVDEECLRVGAELLARSAVALAASDDALLAPAAWHPVESSP